MSRSLTLGLLSLALTLSIGGTLLAQDLDGLDPVTRKVFYHDKTIAVVRTELAGLRSDRIKTAFLSSVYPSRMQVAESALPGLINGMDKQLSDAHALAAQGFTHVTTVVIDNGGVQPAVFHLVKLGELLQIDDAFNVWKAALKGFSKEIEVTKLGNYAVFHQTGLQLPQPGNNQATVENAVSTGLSLKPATATIAWVVMPRKNTEDLVKGLLGEKSASWAALTSGAAAATYTGGYATISNRPELMIFVRFADESKATVMKQEYDSIWKSELAKAIAADQAHLGRIAKMKREQQDTTELEANLVKYPNGEETMRRISEALPAKDFGHVFMIRMSQNHLQELSGVVMDIFLGKS